jgi:hypothetical protein
MDLSKTKYNNVIKYLHNNYINHSRIQSKLCHNDKIYELIVLSHDDYFEATEKRKTSELTYSDCYYYIQLFNNVNCIMNELSVLDCGGYYVAVCIFYDKINVTHKYVTNDKNNFTKFQMNTILLEPHELLPGEYKCKKCNKHIPNKNDYIRHINKRYLCVNGYK